MIMRKRPSLDLESDPIRQLISGAQSALNRNRFLHIVSNLSGCTFNFVDYLKRIFTTDSACRKEAQQYKQSSFLFFQVFHPRG